MPSQRTHVVALEGPSDSGKSTLANGLRDRFGPAVVVLPCYVDVLHPGEAPPVPLAADRGGQLEALEHFIALDHRRSSQWSDELAAAPLAIADRSWLSLAAHMFAVEQQGGPPVYDAGLNRLRTDVHLLRPDLFLYLDAGCPAREARMAVDDRQRWFTDPQFNSHLDHFYRATGPALVPRLERIDAESPEAAVLECAAVLVAASLELADA